MEALKVFDRPTFSVWDVRDDDEPRFLTFGLLRDQAVVIAHTEADDVIRIISVRKAKKHEEANYFEQIAN